MESTAPTLGFAHLLAQSDAVGKTLLAVLLLMSIASWALIVVKGWAQWQRRHRGEAFLNLFWNARALDEVQHVADRVGIIRSGRLVDVDAVDSLRERSLRHVTVTFTEPVDPRELPPPVGGRALAHVGAGLHHLALPAA